MKALRRVLLALIVCAALCAVPSVAFAAEYVRDEAGILPADAEARLDALGTALEKATPGAEIAVVTVKSLGGRDIESVAEERFEKLGVGSSEDDNGVMLIVAPTEKKMRIEVGYGLEGAIPDSKAGRILDEILRPAFQAGDMSGGIEKAYTALSVEVAKEYKVEVDGLDATKGLGTAVAEEGMPWWMALLIFVIIIVVLSTIARKGRFGPPGAGGGWTSGSSSSGSDFGGGGGGGFGGGDSGGGGASGGW